MKKRTTKTKLSLPMSIAIATTATIVLLILFCAAYASLILNGALKNNDFKIAARVVVALSVFIGVRIVIRNNEKYIAATIFTICVLLLILCMAMIFKINISNLLIVLLFILLGIGCGLLFRNLKTKKSHFQKKPYR